jgi:hypothetical protein
MGFLKSAVQQTSTCFILASAFLVSLPVEACAKVNFHHLDGCNCLGQYKNAIIKMALR